MCTISPLQAKEGLCFGMLTSHGLGQLSMDHLSYSQNDMRPTHFLNPKKKFPSFLVIQDFVLENKSRKKQEERDK